MAEFIESYAIWTIWIILGLSFLVLLVMAPCHAVFLLPLVGLPLFWLLPLGYALPINFVIWLASLFLYLVIRRAMKKPVGTGVESAVGATAEVASRLDSKSPVQYLVRYQGELWSAISQDELAPGEQARIVSLRGIKLVVQRIDRRHSTP